MNPESLVETFSNTEMVLNVILAAIVGLILSFIYRFTHKGLSYSQSFSQTIVFISVIVAIVMMVIEGSLARAFALVGALSIIRFRTVLKDTKDMSFIFGALAVGMAAGTSNYYLTVIGTIGITSLAILLNKFNFGAIYKSEFILRFSFLNEGNSQGYLEIINEYCKRSNMLHIEPSGDSNSLNLTYDIALRNDTAANEFIQLMNQIEYVSEVILIASKNDIDY